MGLFPFERIKREILIKREATTDPAFGCPPEQRPTSALLDFGIINLDKPRGPTTHQLTDYVKRILGIRKAGHSGSLDPAVTGVVIVGLGLSTKIARVLLKTGKEYVCVMHLHGDVPEQEIRQSAARFVGRIRQLPPRKAAVKRVLRQREIYWLDVLEVEGRDVLFRVGCEAGTYIRRLCTDWGATLGVGAHMAELRRTRLGQFDEANSWTLHDLKDAYVFWREEQNDRFFRAVVRPVEEAVSHLPKIWLLDSAIDSVCHGASLMIPGIAKLESQIMPHDLVAMLSLKGELVALGEAQLGSGQILALERGMAVRTMRVFMQPGLYPSIKKG